MLNKRNISFRFVSSLLSIVIEGHLHIIITDCEVFVRVELLTKHLLILLNCDHFNILFVGGFRTSSSLR